MTKSNVLEYDITAAANNSDIGGINILGTAPVSNFDNAFRELMLEVGAAVTRHVTKAAGSYTAVKADHNQFWRATGAATFNLTAAATLTTGWALYVKADGGAITIDPSGAETINGAATLTITDGSGAFIVCTGTAFYANVTAAGDVAGPSSATDNSIARFDGATGKLVQNSGVTIDDNNALTTSTTIAGTIFQATSSDGSANPIDMVFIKNSASPAVSDGLARFLAYGNDSGANQTLYGYVNIGILDPTNGSEDGLFEVVLMRAGSLGTAISLSTAGNTINSNTTINGTLTVTG